MLFVADSAKEKISELIHKEGLGEDYFVRVSVTSGGCSGCRPYGIGCLDVFQPTGAHGWTKVIDQSFNSLGNLGAFVLPYVICNSKVDTNLKTRQ